MDSTDPYLLQPEKAPQPTLRASFVKALSFTKPQVKQSFSYFAMRRESESRLLEERSIVGKYEGKLRCMSKFYIVLAIFILLNACIGFSSSPYYERYTSC